MTCCSNIVSNSNNTSSSNDPHYTRSRDAWQIVFKHFGKLGKKFSNLFSLFQLVDEWEENCTPLMGKNGEFDIFYIFFPLILLDFACFKFPILM